MTPFVIASLLLAAAAWAGVASAGWTGPREHRPSARVLALLAALMATVVAGGYAWVGAPQHAGLSPAEAPVPPQQRMAERFETMAVELQRKLAEQPQDAQSWALLARAHAALGRRDDAVAALERAAALRPGDAGMLVDHADFIARLQGPSLAGEPTRLIERALAIDPRHPKALALAGAAAYERHDYDGAVRHWERLAEVPQQDAAAVQQIRARIAQARQMAATPPQAQAPTGGAGASGVPLETAKDSGR